MTWLKAGLVSMATAGLLICAPALQNQANAITTYTEAITCPLNGQPTRMLKYRSYNFVGRRLDTKAILLGSPQVLPLPVCKENGFVIYKNAFTDQELEAAAKLVQTTKFKTMSKAHTSYYLAALEADFLGESQYKVARLYLMASWEAEERRKDLTHEYMITSLEHFQVYLNSAEAQGFRRLFAQLFLANLERKLGKFDDAIGRINGLSLKSFSKKSRAYRTAKRILQLAKQGNTDPGRL